MQFELEPVDYDPFADDNAPAPEEVEGLTLEPVDYNPFPEDQGSAPDQSEKKYNVLGGVKDVGNLLYDLPINTIGAVASMWEDENPEAVHDWKDIARKAQAKRAEERASEAGGNEYVFPGIQRQDIRDASRSAGFSGVAMGAAVPGMAINAAPIPGARVLGTSVAMAGSGAAAYRMAKTDFTQNLIDSFRKTVMEEEGRDVTPEEITALVEDTKGLRSEYGLWEAIPEAAGNIIQLRGIGKLFKASLGRFGSGTASKVFRSLAEMYGGELATETITQMGQHNVEVDAGLSQDDKRSFTDPGAYVESFKEVAPQTMVLTSLTGGSGMVAGKTMNLLEKNDQPQPAPEFDTGDTGPFPGDTSSDSWETWGDEQAMGAEWSQRQAQKEAEAERRRRAADEPPAGPKPPLDPIQEMYQQNQMAMTPPAHEETAAGRQESKDLLAKNIDEFRRVRSIERSQDALGRRQMAMGQSDQSAFQRGLEVRPDESAMAETLPGDMPSFQRNMDSSGGDGGKYLPFSGLADMMTGAGTSPAELPEQDPVRYDDGIDISTDAEFVPSSVRDEKVFQAGLANDDFGAQDLPADVIARQRPVFEHEVEPEKVDQDPTDAQKEAGNYRKDHIKIDGHQITIENPDGSIRKGRDRSGKEWESKIHGHYGYFKRTTGKDGDQVDVFIKPGTETSPKVFVVNQVDPETGRFDEHKVIMGTGSEEEAKALYISNYEDGWRGFGSITEMDQAAFKSWVKDGTRTKRPLSMPPQDSVKKPSIKKAHENNGVSASEAKTDDQESSKPATGRMGNSGTAYLNDNTPVNYTYEVIDLDDLLTSHGPDLKVNPDYPAELQPRDRSRSGSMAQVRKIARELNPDRLMESNSASSGAPVIGKDNNVVESGNGRVIAMALAYGLRGSGKKGRQYAEALLNNAEKLGLSSEEIANMKRPVLVRRRSDDVENLEDFVKKANETEVAKMSPAEQARADSDGITREDMDLFRPSDDGDLTAASNRSFISSFVSRMSAEESAGYMTADGRPTRDLINRIQAAIFQKAYGSEDLLALAAEETDPDIKNILNGLQAAAGKFAKSMAIDSEKTAQIVKPIIDGIQFLRRAQADYPDIKAVRGKTKAFGQVNQALSQQNMFGEKVSDDAQNIAHTLALNIRSGKRIGEFFSFIGDTVRQFFSEQNQNVMFGDKDSFSPLLFINKSLSQLEDKYNDNQGDLFSETESEEDDKGAGEPPPESGNEGRSKEDKSESGTRGEAVRLEPGNDGAESLKKKDLTEKIPPKEEPSRSENRQSETTSNQGKIEDFGEKIGGARKDTSVKTGPSKKKKPPKETGWKSRYQIAQIEHETVRKNGEYVDSDRNGKWGIWDKRKKNSRWGVPQPIGRMLFDTKEEAEEARPILAVAEKHDIYSVGNDRYSIFRTVGNRKRVRVVKEDFESRDAAKRFLVKNAEDVLSSKLSFGEEILPKPETVFRAGENRRDGDVSPDAFGDVFGFRGVEFGNWVSKTEERQEVMNHTYDALLDMAEILRIPPKAVSLNGELAIAFGARGQGLSGAAAHYEPAYAVINLTKMAGAGHLAHEWFHAFDHYVGRLDGKADSEKTTNSRGYSVYPGQDPRMTFASHGFQYKSEAREELKSAYVKFIKTMISKGEKYVEDTVHAERFISRAKDALKSRLDDIRNGLAQQLDKRYWKRKNAPATPEQLSRFDQLAGMLLSGEQLEIETQTVESKRSRFPKVRYTNAILDEMSDIYKAVRGRTGFSENGDNTIGRLRHPISAYRQRIELLNEAKSKTEKRRKVPTNFLLRSKEADQARASDYWSTEHELAARAFAAYLEDRLSDGNANNDFLVYHAHGAILAPVYPEGLFMPYPQGDERVEINKAFDNLFKTIKSKETYNGVALYLTSDDLTDQPPGQGVSLEDIQARFKEQDVFLRPDGTIAIRFENGVGLEIENSKEIDDDKVELAMRIGRMGENGNVLGHQTQKGFVLNRDLASNFTLDHELWHYLKRVGMIDKKDSFALAGAMNRMKAQKGRLTFKISNKKEENEVNTFAQILAERKLERDTVIGRLIQKVMDFMNGLWYVGRQSARKLAREVESEKIFGRKAKTMPVYEFAGNSNGNFQSGRKQTGISDANFPHVELRETGKIQVPRGSIKGPGEIAGIFSAISDAAQEEVWGVATDKQGRILEVHKFSKGLSHSAPGHVNQMTGHLLKNKAVHALYIVHNHPGGEVYPSQPDIRTMGDISASLRLNKITPKGIVISDGKYVEFDERDIDIPENIPPIGPSKSSPILERRITKRSPQPDFVIDERDPENQIRRFDGEDDGILLADGGGQEITFIPYEKGKTIRQAATDILSKAAKHNATLALINVKNIDKTNRWKLYGRLANGLASQGIKVLDVVTNHEITGPMSLVDIGKMYDQNVEGMRALDSDEVLFMTSDDIISEKFHSQSTFLEKMKEAVEEGKAEGVDRAIAKTVDGLHFIKKRLGDETYKLHRMLTGIKSASFSMFLEHGKMSWDGNALTVKDRNNGVLPFLRSIGDDWQNLFYWTAAKRAEQLEKEGRENWLDKNARDKIFEKVGTHSKKGQSWAILNSKFQEFNKNILDIMEQSGLIDPESRAVWESNVYIPFYRILEDDISRQEFLSGPRRSKKHISSQIKQLKGGRAKIGDPMENILMNWMHGLDAAARNKARAKAFEVGTTVDIIEEVEKKDLARLIGAQTVTRYAVKKDGATRARDIFDTREEAEDLADELVRRGKGQHSVEPRKETKAIFGSMKDYGILSFQKNGKPVYFKTDDTDLYEALSEVDTSAFNNVFMRLMGGAKRLLSYGATFGPAFRIRNMIRDTVHTAVVSKSFLPFVDTGIGFLKSMREDQDYIEFMASGFGFGSSYVHSDDPGAGAKFIKRIIKEEGKGAASRILDTPKKVLDFWEKIGSASENAARLGLYRNLKNKGMSKFDAGFEGRDLMDFSMRGNAQSIQMITRVVPFLNARVQGLYKLGRASKENPKAFLLKSAMLTTASLTLWSMFKDDDRYKELEDWDKWTYYHFWVGGDHYRIPKPFEIGALFSSLPESVANVMNDTEDGKFVWSWFRHTARDVFNVDMPQLFKPVVEERFNMSTFKGRPVVPEHMTKLKPSEQYNPWTSDTMRMIGDALNVSPIKLEHYVNGYFSTIGMMVLSGVDVVTREAMGYPDRPAGSRTPFDLRIVESGDVSRNTKSVTRFYDLYKEVETANSTIRNYLKTGQIDKAREYFIENRQMLSLKAPVYKIRAVLADVNREIKRVQRSKRLGPVEKRDQIARLNKIKANITKELFQKIKSSR